MAGIPELGQGRKLLHVVEAWLREEKAARRRRAAEAPAAAPAAPKAANPLFGSRQMMYYRG